MSWPEAILGSVVTICLTLLAVLLFEMKTRP